MSREGWVGETVAGERSVASANAARSIQSRMSTVLAAGLMIALGLGALSWYYANAFTRQRRLHQATLATSVSSAQGEMTLPPLGSVPPPPRAQPELPAQAPAVLTQQSAELPRGPSADAWSGLASVQDPDHLQAKQTATDRRLSGVAFASDSKDLPLSGADPQNPAIGSALGGRASGELAGAHGENGLPTLLRPTQAAPALAHVLPTQRLLLPKGAFIDCTLETAIDSTLPGMTTCVTATDTFGVDGKVVLLERGSKLIGETRGAVQNGSARVFVLWTEARTPAGVIVPLDSPGTDELGRSGLPGAVNHHFWDRFGAALLISVIDGGMQAAGQAAARGNGTILYNPSTSQDAVTEVLKSTVNVAPSVVKHNGDRIQILVARDLDFRAVYELHDITP